MSDPAKPIRWHEAQGRILRSRRTGITFVPYGLHRDSWDVVVVDPGPSPECQRSYPRGGYNLCVDHREIEDDCEEIKSGFTVAEIEAAWASVPKRQDGLVLDAHPRVIGTLLTALRSSREGEQ